MVWDCSTTVTTMFIFAVFLSSQYPTSYSRNIDMSGSGSSRVKPAGPNTRPTPPPPSHRPFHCPRENSPQADVRVCSIARKSSKKSPREFQDCFSRLSLVLKNVSIQICINHNQLLLPNASIVYVSESTHTYPFYYEEMARNIKSFFTGRVWIFQTSFSFSGDIYRSTFQGKAIILGTIFVLQCGHVASLPKAFRVGECYTCRAFCSYPGTTNAFPNLYNDVTIRISFNDSTHPGTASPRQTHRKHRLKRQSPANGRKLTCSLHLVSDHLFFEYVGGSDVTKTTNIMLGLVNKVDSIFRNNFNAKRGLVDVGFAVKHVTVFQTEESSDYKLSGSYMTSDDYLEKFSLYDFSSVCLAVGFTFRNFGGVLGTAFPASFSSRMPGGICAMRRKINSHFVSYNTVIMSFFGSRGELSEEIIVLALTHELGHSFGARHDVKECLPGNRVGNYIMSAMVNSGEKPNNFMFSPCSLQTMMPVILLKETCLRSPNLAPVCGNAIPEEGEECDCGTSSQCDTMDPCCTPADDTSHTPCTIRRYEGKLCSPRVSSCCNASCAYIAREVNKICNALNVCSRKTTCDGKGEHCPPSLPAPRGTPCRDGRYVCQDRACDGNVCLYHRLTPCTCQSLGDTCTLCCRGNGSDLCQPASRFGILHRRLPIVFRCPFLDGEATNLSLGHIIAEPIEGSNRHDGLHGWPIMACLVVSVLVLIICSSVSQRYEPHVSDRLKAFRCGKLLAIYSFGEYQSEKYKRCIIELNTALRQNIDRVQGKTRMDYPEAVARLATLFPIVPIPYISELVKICANETMAVRVLLTQGAPMRTFCKSIKSLKTAMRRATIRYKK